MMKNIKKWISGAVILCMLAAAVIMEGNGTQAATAYAASKIGVKKAKSIALDHAGLKASEVTFTKAKLDREDGRTVYDVEFYTEKEEYDYEIDAKSGKIVKYDQEYDDHHKKDENSADLPARLITKAKAKAAALKHAGLTEKEVDAIRVKKDRDDGAVVYEIEFYEGNTEYSYEIDAHTGEIIEWEKEYDD